MRFADIRQTLLAAERLLLPSECLLCHEPVEERAGDSLVCELCQSRWRRLTEPVCGRSEMPRRECRALKRLATRRQPNLVAYVPSRLAGLMPRFCMGCGRAVPWVRPSGCR